MASQTPTIQFLLSAEKMAKQRIAEAKIKAQEEIEKCRQEQEEQFKEFEVKLTSLQKDITAGIDADTKVKIDQIDKAVTVNKETVTQNILDLVNDIEPELPRNFKSIES